MAKKLDIRLNRGGVRDALRSPEALRAVRDMAEQVAAAAGPGHRVEVELGRNRARAAVIADTWPARRAEARDRNLTRALDAARR